MRLTATDRAIDVLLRAANEPGAFARMRAVADNVVAMVEAARDASCRAVALAVLGLRYACTRIHW